ncbi:MAG: hypothetical protein KA715_08060 [Xanthomonadaceae bacterium]|nr:hypothetical protein [Xanthomonadaceae bacterium]
MIFTTILLSASLSLAATPDELKVKAEEIVLRANKVLNADLKIINSKDKIEEKICLVSGGSGKNLGL